jgi:hypothetical protein
MKYNMGLDYEKWEMEYRVHIYNMLKIINDERRIINETNFPYIEPLHMISKKDFSIFLFNNVYKI